MSKEDMDQNAMMQMLAQGQPQAPVDVAGCGVGGYPGAWLPGGQGCGPGGSPLPYVPSPYLIGPNALYQSSVIPLGFSACFDSNGNVVTVEGSGVPTPVGSAIDISVGNNSQFYVCGIRTFTGPSNIEIVQISGGGGFNVFPGPVDAAVYNTDDCFCPIDLPCISPFSPLTIAARAIPNEPCVSTVVTVQELRGALFGYWIRNLTGCSPISTLPLLGSGPLLPPSPFAAGPCPPTAPGGVYGAGQVPGNGMPGMQYGLGQTPAPTPG